MVLIILLIALVISSSVSISLVKPTLKGWVAVCCVSLVSLLSGFLAVPALNGSSFEFIFAGSAVTGTIPVRIDALSGWFMLLINLTFLTGVFYGVHYITMYKKTPSDLSLHWICFILVQASLNAICIVQNSLIFLICWEIMALSAFVLVIFEHQKNEVLSAGINYLIQSHVSILFLTLGFLWVASKTNSYDFKVIHDFSLHFPLLTSLALFFCFFIGFAIKAGFVPFHTWLPHAHPVAPAHISGVMSGVIIKIGIYGILRMVLLIKSDYSIMGYAILFLSVVSGIYGVMLAILQHDLKKLLAYHSIENIGIIGIGIGIGCIGLGNQNQIMVILGFGGALLHTLNHSLFKSLLFFGAGNVYMATHVKIIDRLGGLVKKMPQTALLFLVASLAICGLPPFNGFISEFFIYSGMFRGMKGAELSGLFFLVFSVLGLTLIGGLALLCFTKAFGIVFLGSAREKLDKEPQELKTGQLFPLYFIGLIIVVIGVFPQYIIQLLREPVGLFARYPGYQLSYMSFPYTETIVNIGYGAAIFLVVVGLLFGYRKYVTRTLPVQSGDTWGCAYPTNSPKLQYTASSFVRSYTKLAGPLLSIYKHKEQVEGIFPAKVSHHTHAEDKIEEWMITHPMVWIRHAFNRLSFLQNGNPQFYVLYGLLFITLVLLIPMVIESIQSMLLFLNHL